ncbi:MAG: hypothetical protein ACOYNX_11755 [Geothrix sp.]
MSEERPKKGKSVPSRGSKPGERRGAAGKGRPKGSRNKITASVKDAALAALNSGEGATEFFKNRKDSDPNAFMAFLKGVLPLDVTLANSDGSPLSVTVNFKKPND